MGRETEKTSGRGRERTSGHGGGRGAEGTEEERGHFRCREETSEDTKEAGNKGSTASSHHSPGKDTRTDSQRPNHEQGSDSNKAALLLTDGGRLCFRRHNDRQ